MSRSAALVALSLVGLSVGASTSAAAVLIGPNTAPVPETSQTINFSSQMLVFNPAAPPGVRVNSPIAGVITEWRMYVGDVSAGSTAQLRVMTPLGGADYLVTNSGPAHALPASSGQANLIAFSDPIPIAVGQIIGFGKANDPDGGFLEITIPQDQPAPSGWQFGYFLSPPPDGASGTATIEDADIGADRYVPLSADIEPDADGDLFGDESQDECPGVAGPDRGCPPRDADPPETTITKDAPKRTQKAAVKFGFESDEAGAAFECSLKGRGLDEAVKRFVECASPRKYKNLDPGRYIFKVRAIDAAGNVDPVPAKDRFRVLP